MQKKAEEKKQKVKHTVEEEEEVEARKPAASASPHLIERTSPAPVTHTKSITALPHDIRQSLRSRRTTAVKLLGLVYRAAAIELWPAIVRCDFKNEDRI